VTIVDNQHELGHDGPATFRTVGGVFYFLKPGDHYNLETREPSRPGAAGATAFACVIAQPCTPPGRP
jgi:hypothetical protein